MNKYKQIIVMRRDLNMSTGKAVAQGSHASTLAIIETMDKNPFMLNSAAYIDWTSTGYTKVVVQVTSLAKLDNIYKKCQDADISFLSYVVDEGRTEFDEPTATCIAIGPWDSTIINPITKRLQLYKD